MAKRFFSKSISYPIQKGFLDVCRDDDDDDGDGDNPEDAFDEMDAILGISFGDNPSRSPQIELAIADGHMAFYTHQKCYKHIERMWRPFEWDTAENQMEGGATALSSTTRCCQRWVVSLLQPLLVLALSPMLYFCQSPLNVEEMKEERKNQLLKERSRWQRQNTVGRDDSNHFWLRAKVSTKKWLNQMATPRNRQARVCQGLVAM